MKKKMKSFIVLALFAQISIAVSQFLYYAPSNFHYYVPRPTFKAFNPSGFRMSIPDWSGIESVTFEVKVDQRISGVVPKRMTYRGQRDYTNNRWSMMNHNTLLNGGDIVYFTITVRKDGRIYKYENGRILVTEHSFSSEESFESKLTSSEERGGRYRYWRWSDQRTPKQREVRYTYG